MDNNKEAEENERSEFSSKRKYQPDSEATYYNPEALERFKKMVLEYNASELDKVDYWIDFHGWKMYGYMGDRDENR